MPLQYYDLPEGSLEDRHYRVFPEDIESDPLIVFHATPAANLDSIVENGLLPGNMAGANLETISYGEDSMAAMIRWQNHPLKAQEWVVLALKFSNRDELYDANGTTHSNALRVQPEIAGVIVLPAGYRLQ